MRTVRTANSSLNLEEASAAIRAGHQTVAGLSWIHGHLAILKSTYYQLMEGRRLTNSPNNNVLPSWSRDGNWIYFASDRSGHYEVWKLARDGGEAVQVTSGGGYATQASPDGNYLYYTKLTPQGPNALFRIPVNGGEALQVLPAVGAFCVTSKGIYFVSAESGRNTIQFLHNATGKVSTLASSGKRVEPGLAVSPDDAYVVWSQVDRETVNLMLVEGFR